MSKLFLIICLFAASLTSAQTIQNTAKEISQDIIQEQWVDSIYDQLSLKEKIGQLVMVMVRTDNDGSTIPELERKIDSGLIGGIIFFKRNALQAGTTDQ